MEGREEGFQLGVFVRLPNPPKTPWDAVNQGYEIQIADSYDPERRTGSIYSFKAPTGFASHEPGEWNTFEIKVLEQKYTIMLNGVKINEFTGERGEQGYIGLHNHLPADKVWFRNVRVLELKQMGLACSKKSAEPAKKRSAGGANGSERAEEGLSMVSLAA